MPQSGDILIVGGDNWTGSGTTNTGNPNTNIFDPSANTLTSAADMNRERWYSSSTVLVNGDTRGEPDETFFVRLSSPTNATVADGQGVGTIRNDDASGSGFTASTTVTGPQDVRAAGHRSAGRGPRTVAGIEWASILAALPDLESR